MNFGEKSVTVFRANQSFRVDNSVKAARELSSAALPALINELSQNFLLSRHPHTASIFLIKFQSPKHDIIINDSLHVGRYFLCEKN